MHTPLRFFILLLSTLLLAAQSARAGKRVLYLGDSMSMGAFGVTLDQRLREAGLEVYTSVTGGATPYYWLKEFEPIEADIGHWSKTPTQDQRLKKLAAVPKIEDLMTQIDPDIVIVQTGINLYSTLRSKRTTPEQGLAKVESLTLKMVDAVTSRGAKLYWITPPSSHPDRFSFELQSLMLDLTIRAVGKHGRVFNSYAVTKFTEAYPPSDGIHYGPKDAAAWGEAVAHDAVPFMIKGRGAKTPPAAATPAPEEVRRARVVQEDVPAQKSSPSPITAEIRLVKKSDFATPAEITYNNALAVYEWEVLRVINGAYREKKILVAHTVVRNRRITNDRDLKLGKTYLVELVPLSTYPTLERWETIDHVSSENDFSRTVYIPKM